MTTWTESARSTLEGHLARLRENLASSGADPIEVTDDVRRHIDEELAVRRIGVVTTEDVETILQRIGLPSASLNGSVRAGAGAGVRGGEEEAELARLGRGEMPGPGTPLVEAGQSWHRWLLFFGVALPTMTVIIELLTHMCAAAFFDPIPGWGDIVLVGSVPAANLLVWRAVCVGRALGGRWLGMASAWSLGVAAYYSLLYATLSPFAAFAVIFFGWGLLPLSPLLAFAAAWRLRVLAGRIPSVAERGGLGGWGWGLGLAAVAMGLVVVPPVLTRQWSRAAASGESDEAARALRWLRAWGHERTLLADCYGATRWALENPFRVHVQGTPVPPEMARNLFYRVTGHAFNEFPPPQLAYQTRGWEVLGDLEWDPDQGGAAVGGRLRGLSVAQSRMDGLIDGDAGWAYTEWILEFKNVAGREREARAQIALPPGGVVSRVTLWVNGEEREAAFAGSGEVREAYEKVVRVFRRDPILVTHAGEDRVLMQCYPVPANGGTMKVRLGITAPVEVENAATAILRWPRFLERNFSVPANVEHALWVESAQALVAPHPKLASDHGRPGVFALRGVLPDDELGQPSALVRIPRSIQAGPAWVADPHGGDGQFIRQTLVQSSPSRPGRIVLVIDGSRSMDDLLPVVAGALLHLPEGVELSVLLARDEVEEWSGPVRKADAGFLRELSNRLAKVRGVGGQDNVSALARGWDLASAGTDGVLLWIHGPQPVDSAQTEPLEQRLTWRRASPGAGPRVHELQVVPGANRVTEKLSRLTSVQPLPRFGSVQDDLQRLFVLWRGEAVSHEWRRERLPAGGVREVERGTKSSKHLARLWAKDEVERLVARRQRDEAVKVAGRYQLVTPVSGAVVLETQEQFAQAGLKPAAPETVPSVPEPGVIALLVLGVVMLAGRRWWCGPRRGRGDGPSRLAKT